MKRAFTHMALAAAIVLAGAIGRAAAQPLPADEQQALRARVEQRYDVVPLAVGVALTPKSPRGDVRLVEISDTIAINGVVSQRPRAAGAARRGCGHDSPALVSGPRRFEEALCPRAGAGQGTATRAAVASDATDAASATDAGAAVAAISAFGRRPRPDLRRRGRARR